MSETKRLYIKKALICAGIAAGFVFPVDYAAVHDSFLLAIVMFVSLVTALIFSAYFIFKAEDIE
jgi:purine-cytosine permease-like protein